MSIKAKGDIMTFEQALQKAQNKQPKDYLCHGALDMGEFWAFSFHPKLDKDDWWGGGYDTVNKKTGELGTFNPPDDLELFAKAKRIKIK